MATKRRVVKPKARRAREAGGTYSTGIVIDKAALRKMLEDYKLINIEDEKASLRAAKERTPSEAFEAFLDLWKFGQGFASHNPRQRQEKLDSMLRYYERIKQFESWRRSRAS